MSETELKYGVPESAAPAIDASLRRLGGKLVSIESRYFDSNDGRLAAAGLSLRLRKSGGRWEQTVKAPGRHAADRLEETVPRPGRWDGAGPAIEPALHDGTRAGALMQSTLKGDDAGPAALVHVHTSRVKRRFAEIGSGTGRVEVAFDRGEVVAGDRSMPIREVEYELKAGEPQVLLDFARAGIVAHGMRLSTLSKAAHGDALARHAGRFAPVRARPPALQPDMDAAALRRAVMSTCIDQVSANASILAEGQLDDEVVHQLRIGLRRLRTAARELPREGESEPPPWDAPITELFHRLGEHRDRSIVAASVGHELAVAGSPEPSLEPPTDDVDPVALVRGRGVQLALLDVLGEAMAAGTSERDDGDVHAAIATRLGTLHASMKKAAHRFDRLGDDERHRVRKRLKRLRYFAELIGPLHDPRAVRRYLAKLRPAQDALGAYIDLIVGIEFARERVAAGDERAWFNVGWLCAQLPRGVKRCRRALEDAAKARPFWRRPSAQSRRTKGA